jgi:SOH1
MYWTQPAYVKFVTFPHALYFLPLLQREAFRTALKSPQYALLLHQQQGFHWQFSASPAFRPLKPGDPPPILPNPAGVPAEPGAPSPSVADPSPSPGFETPAATPALQTPGPP